MQSPEPAEECPLCGRPIERKAAASRWPVFVFVAFIALGLGMGSDALAIYFPLVGAVAFAVVSLARKESPRAFAVVALTGAIGLALLAALVDLYYPSWSYLTWQINAPDVVVTRARDDSPAPGSAKRKERL
jgi:hypothetical protein